MKYLVLITYRWTKFEYPDPGDKKPQHKIKKRKKGDYTVLCIFYPMKEAVKDLLAYITEDVFEKACPNPTREETIVLFHEPFHPWSGDTNDFDKFKNWVKTHSILYDEYSGGQHWVYNEIIDKLGDWDKLNANKLPGWEAIKKKFHIDYLESIGNSLFPLHLALQSFFAISRDEEMGWQTLPDDLLEQAGKNYNKLFLTEYREKAFLLVKEAGYDYFAEIGNRLGPFSDSALKKPIDERPLLNLVEEIFKDKTILNCHGFKDENNRKINGKALKEKLGYIINDEKATLKTLCAILSNISDDGFNQEKRKGNLPNNAPALHKRRIRGSKKQLKVLPECREWLQKPAHTKWPKDLDGGADQPDDSYRNLVDQLTEWNSDDEKARTVIEMIETIGFYLEQIAIYFDAEAIR